MSVIFKEYDSTLSLFGLYKINKQLGNLIEFTSVSHALYNVTTCDDVSDMNIVDYYICLSNNKKYGCIYVTDLEVVYFDDNVLRIGNKDNFELSHLDNNLNIIDNI